MQQAILWLRRASESGEVLAQVNLGNMYFTGTGVKQDYRKRRNGLRWVPDPVMPERRTISD